MYYISVVSTTKNGRTENPGITLPISLLKQIEDKRGDVPRNVYSKSGRELSKTKQKVMCHVWFY
jgi:hypothetical protein